MGQGYSNAKAAGVVHGHRCAAVIGQRCWRNAPAGVAACRHSCALIVFWARPWVSSTSLSVGVPNFRGCPELPWVSRTSVGVPNFRGCPELRWVSRGGRPEGQSMPADTRSLPPGADTISWIMRSVTRGSRPSVWPLSRRTTSATTRPSSQSG